MRAALKLGNRRANIQLAVALLITGGLLIASVMMVLLNPELFFIIPPEPIPITIEPPDIIEDPLNVSEIKTLKEALADLQSEDVLIVNTTKITGYSDGIGFGVTYTEFRKVALKKELVFLFTEFADKRFTPLIIPYEKTFVVWTPSPK